MISHAHQIFGICQTIIVSNAVGSGLGIVLENVPQYQLEVQEKVTLQVPA